MNWLIHYREWANPRSAVSKVEAWSPRKGDSVIPVQVKGLESEEPVIKYQPESQQAWRQRASVSVWVKDRERLMSQLKVVRKEELLLTQRGSDFLFYLGLQLIGWEQSILEVNLLYSVTDSKVNPIQKHTHRHTQNNAWPSIWSFHSQVNT